MEAFSVPRLKAASESEMVKSLFRVNDASATEVSSTLEFPPNALGMSCQTLNVVCSRSPLDPPDKSGQALKGRSARIACPFRG